jgi:hypothetical protein
MEVDLVPGTVPHVHVAGLDDQHLVVIPRPVLVERLQRDGLAVVGDPAMHRL